MNSFHDTYAHFPLGEYNDDLTNWGWGTLILPFIEQGNLWNALINDTTVNGYWMPPGFGGGSNAGAWSGSPNIDNLNGGQAGYGKDITNTTAGTPTLGYGAATVVLKTFICPSDNLPNNKGASSTNLAKTNYAGNLGNIGGIGCSNGTTGATENGVLLIANDNNNTYVQTMASITDGTSNTVIISEVSGSATVSPTNNNTNNFPCWAGGNNGGCGSQIFGGVGRYMTGAYPLNTQGTGADQAFGSRHTNCVNFLLVDGSVHTLTTSVDYTIVYPALGSCNGGEVFASPW
jgi:Protein of unknown function (DUF1559)